MGDEITTTCRHRRTGAGWFGSRLQLLRRTTIRPERPAPRAYARRQREL